MLKLNFNLFGRKKYFVHFHLTCRIFGSCMKSFGMHSESLLSLAVHNAHAPSVKYYAVSVTGSDRLWHEQVSVSCVRGLIQALLRISHVAFSLLILLRKRLLFLKYPDRSLLESTAGTDCWQGIQAGNYGFLYHCCFKSS